MTEVRLYIQTDSKSPRRMKRRFGHVLACIIDGREITREGFGEAETTYHGAGLMALEKGMARLTGKNDLVIFSEDEWILTNLQRQLGTWAKQDFLNAKGNPIADQAAWLHIWIMSQEHRIEVRAGRHEYTEWMLTQMKEKT